MLRPTQVPCSDRIMPFAYGALTLFGWLSQYHSTKHNLGNCPSDQQLTPACTSYPVIRNACWLALVWFGLAPVRSPLLGGSLRFLFLRVLRCFTSPGSSPVGVTELLPWGCPIQRSAGQCLLAARRGVSPLAASFVARMYQGIRPLPLIP